MPITKENLRIEFVEMLFALAIAEVAIELSTAIFNGISFIDSANVYSHLFLGAMIITMSWIGWQSSSSKGNNAAIDNIFSIPFLILLTDILLVIIYFIIVKGADFDVKDGKATPRISVNNEIYWSKWVFVVYIFWDFITKGLDIKYIKVDNKNLKKTVHLNLKAFGKRVWPGVVCLVIVLFFYRFRNGEFSVWQAFIIDISLFFIFVLFRGLKPDIKRNTSVHRSEISESVFAGIGQMDDTFTVRDKLFFMKRLISIFIPLVAIIIGYFLISRV